MSRLTYSFKLFREYYLFARERGIYWIVPLVMFVTLMGLLIVASEAAAPLLYTLF